MISPRKTIELNAGTRARVSTEVAGEAAAQYLEVLSADDQVVSRLGDTDLRAISSQLSVKSAVLDELLDATGCSDSGNPFVDPPFPRLNPQESAAARTVAAAQYYVDILETQNVAGTCQGVLACAWAVNYVVKIATLQPVGGGVSTILMRDALHARGTPEFTDIADALPGDILLSPTAQHPGHVGIVGEGHLIYSNSTSVRRWRQNYTLETWRDSFVGLHGLELNIFRLWQE
jgi:hypothetical protein